jgi:hypothetical protein
LALLYLLVLAVPVAVIGALVVAVAAHNRLTRVEARLLVMERRLADLASASSEGAPGVPAPSPAPQALAQPRSAEPAPPEPESASAIPPAAGPARPSVPRTPSPGLQGVFRALSFLGLGLVLIGIGWLYQRLLFPRPTPGPGLRGTGTQSEFLISGHRGKPGRLTRPGLCVPGFQAGDGRPYRLVEAASSGRIDRGRELLTSSARPPRLVN